MKRYGFGCVSLYGKCDSPATEKVTFQHRHAGVLKIETKHLCECCINSMLVEQNTWGTKQILKREALPEIAVYYE